MSGQVSYLSGLCAEDQVARKYARSGHRILARRWRGPGGELDLVAEKDDVVVFVEVKKSRSHARAAEALSQRQLGRIYRSAEAFVGTLPRGLNTDARVDVALLDRQGEIELLENVLCA